jgi:hypothetical protein
MSKIFISYRRQGSRPPATLLHDRLGRHFNAKYGAGAVFMDVNGTQQDANSRTYLSELVARTDLLLALITRGWLTSTDGLGRRRLNSPNDFVHIEIDAALKGGIPVVPVYVDGAEFLHAVDLPDSLKELARLSGITLSTDARHLESGIARLIDYLEAILAGAIRPAAAPPQPAAPASKTASAPELPEPKPAIRYEDAARRLVRTFRGHGEPIRSVAISHGGTFALSASGEQRVFNRIDRSLRFWDLASGACRILAREAEIIWSVALTPDDRFALFASGDRTLKLLDVGSGKPVRTLAGHWNWVLSAAISADGQLALSGGADRTLKLWQLATGEEVRSFSGHDSLWVSSVAFSPDSRTVLSGSHDDTLKLWSVFGGEVIWDFTGHTGHVRSVAFSPDGGTVLSGSDDNTLKLWDVSSGEEIRTFTGHAGNVRAVAFSPDGRFALSGSGDWTLRLWNVATGKTVWTFAGHAGEVNSVAFSPDGRFALSGSDDTTLKLWHMPE